MNHLTPVLCGIAAAAILFLLFRFWYKQGYYANEINRLKNKVPITPQVLADAYPDSITAPTLQNTVTSEEKGLAFEKFVIDRFDKRYFTLLDWKSDKYHNGVYPLSSCYPDLVYQYRSKFHEVQFAVECKWRQSFSNYTLQWAKAYQRNNYIDFSHQTGMQVFVILGVGGTPDQPDDVFILRLDDLHSLWLHEADIQLYKRYRADKAFFLHTGSMKLE